MKRLFQYVSTNWYEKLTSVFTAVILAKLIAVFDGFWWEETYAIAYYTLFTAAAFDILLPIRHRFAKRLLQLAAALLITIQLARMDWLIAKPERWQEWIWWLQVHSVQLHPFIWISGALLLLYVLFNKWTTTRPRMFGFIGVSIVSLTIADSFTPIWLWDEVGWVVFIGLLWLVANHMSRLQRDHPSSWKELIEYPLQLILPIVLVLSLLMAVGLNMPSLSPLLQDPYTIWKEAKGEQVQVFLGDKGLEAITPGTSGNTSSGYSRSDDSLGGGFEYDYSPVMTVSTSQRSYWRGESKAFYSGNGWSDVDGDEDGSSFRAIQKGAALPIRDERPLAETVEVNQIVTMIRKDVYPVLFAAAPVTKINWIGSEEAVLPNGLTWLPGSLELHWLGGARKKYPETYSVTSSIPVLDEEALRAATAGWTYTSRNALYLQLPDTLPSRVRELAEEITAEATNDYDRARLLESYLRLNFVYNNNPDETLLTGTSVDFVDQFLFELKEGYCDYFSTSMAVMARSIGLPARWVKGFAPGVLPASSYGGPPEDMLEDMNPTGAGTYTVRNSDAHSWVEIYFEGFGWIPFEATANFSFPYTIVEDETETLPESETDSAAEAVASTPDGDANVKLWAWSSAALLVVLGAVWLFVRRAQVVILWRRFRFGSYTTNDRIVIETHKLLRICKKRGMERQEHETLREAVLRWSQSQKRLRDDFRFVLDGFEHAKYSPVIASDEETERFVLKVKSLIDQIR